MADTGLTLSILTDPFGICRLPQEQPLPDWATGSFLSITRTADELSIVCPQTTIPDGVRCEPDWRCLKVEGPLDFSLTGILAQLAVPLAQAAISIFAISTFDTDYLMVKADRLDQALATLQAAGHTISTK